MRLFVDTSILIHDFMHRHPAVAEVRNLVPQQADLLVRYRDLVHQKLAALARHGAEVHTTSNVLWRLAALMTDWYIPPQVARIEMQYLLSNYNVHDLGRYMLENSITALGTDPKTGLDEMGWQLLGQTIGVKTLLTCQAHQPEEWPGWELLKPETLIID